MIKCWYRDGYSFQEMADKIGVSLKVFKEARNEFEEFDQALIESKECIDYKVENALLKSALGFTTKEVKVTTLMRYGKVVETQKEVLEKLGGWANSKVLDAVYIRTPKQRVRDSLKIFDDFMYGVIRDTRTEKTDGAA